MIERFQLPIALWRLQYHLLGGNRRIVGVSCVYATALLAGAFGCRRLFWRESLDEVAAGMLYALAAIQIFIAVLGGCNAIHRASLRDYESKMIESHRLTPMSNVTVVLGYLFGTTLQMQGLFVVGLIVGIVLTAWAEFPVKEWIMGNLIILNGAVSLWSAVLLSGLRQAKPISPAGFLIGAAALGNVGVVLLPAAGLLLSAYPLLIGFQVITGGVSVSGSVIIMIVTVNVLMTLFWLSAAAAKYRRPDLPALNAVRGLILLAFWVVAGTVGSVVYFSASTTGLTGQRDNDMLVFQWVGTMALSFLIALPAIAGSVECCVLIRCGTLARGWADRISPILVCWLATVVVILPMTTIGSDLTDDILLQSEVENPFLVTVLVWSYSVAACFLAFVMAKQIHVVCFGRVKKPRTLATSFLLLIWALPPIIDMARAEWAGTVDVYAAPESSWLAGCSPVGTIVEVWRNPLVEGWTGPSTELLLPGLWFQLLVVIGLGLVGGPRRPKQPDAPPSHPSSEEESQIDVSTQAQRQEANTTA